MTFTPKLCAEKRVATISDFPSSSGTSGYSGGESDSLTVETVLHPVVQLYWMACELELWKHEFYVVWGIFIRFFVKHNME